jgi:hypothetical protein
MKEILEMSKNEIDRYHIIKKLVDHQINQKKAEEMLNLLIKYGYKMPWN